MLNIVLILLHLQLKTFLRMIILGFFLDGNGYVDDGREIFDDDLNEDPEGIYASLVSFCFALDIPIF